MINFQLVTLGSLGSLYVFVVRALMRACSFCLMAGLDYCPCLTGLLKVGLQRCQLCRLGIAALGALALSGLSLRCRGVYLLGCRCLVGLVVRIVADLAGCGVGGLTLGLWLVATLALGLGRLTFWGLLLVSIGRLGLLMLGRPGYSLLGPGWRAWSSLRAAIAWSRLCRVFSYHAARAGADLHQGATWASW